MKLIPAILEHDWAEIEKKLELAKTFTDTVHIDIIDGKFANNTTFLDPTPFKKYSGELYLELHMMVIEPSEYVERWGNVGFRRFLGQVEHMSDKKEFLDQARKYGEAFFGIDALTPVEDSLFGHSVDGFTLLSVKAGYSGQEFMPEVLAKIPSIREKSDKLIEIDGGMNDKTIIEAKNAGADIFTAASFLWKSENPNEQFKILENLLV